MTVAQPVAATPLQTIIQPDAATTPIANVLVASGPSPLTAPAAAVPALFDHPNPLQPVVDTVTTTTPVYTGTPSTANIPTTITKTVPTPGTVVTPDPTIPKTPDSGITKTPGVGITPTPGSGTGSEPTATKLPTATDTHTPGTTAVPTHSGSTPTPDDDVTTPNTGGAGGTTPSTGGPGSTPSTGAGAGTTGHTAPSTQPQPSADIPTVDVPTQQPTVPHNEPAPTLAPITPTMDVEVPSAQVPVPTAQPPVMPMKPPTGSDPRPHAIAGDLGSPSGFFDHHDPSMFVPVDDHSALTIMVAGGLATPLLPDTTMAETHHLMPGGLDIVLM
jgi:hypothetical protein